jgi:hypothetical protein
MLRHFHLAPLFAFRAASSILPLNAFAQAGSWCCWGLSSAKSEELKLPIFPVRLVESYPQNLPEFVACHIILVWSYLYFYFSNLLASLYVTVLDEDTGRQVQIQVIRSISPNFQAFSPDGCHIMAACSIPTVLRFSEVCRESSMKPWYKNLQPIGGLWNLILGA